MAPIAGGYRLTYAADRDWLSAPERKFPVVLDPTVHLKAYSTYTATATNDTTLSRTYETANPALWSTYGLMFTGQNDDYRSLLRFDLAQGSPAGAIPQDAEVLDAWTALYPTGVSGSPGELGLYPVTAPWDWNSATWANRQAGTPWASPGGDIGSSPAATTSAPRAASDPWGYAGWYDWSITDLVQGWVNGTEANNGLLVRQTAAGNPGYALFQTYDAADYVHWPRLYVWYRPAPIGARPQSAFVDDAMSDGSQIRVDAATGNLLIQTKDLEIAGTEHPLSLGRFFNSRSADTSSNLGSLWGLDAGMDVSLTVFPDGNATFFGRSGEGLVFKRQTNGTFAAPTGVNAALVVDALGTGTLTMVDTGEAYQFVAGVLTAFSDGNGNTINYTYAGAGTSTVLASLVSGDREATLARAESRVTAVTDSVSGSVSYGYDVAGRLETVTRNGAVTRYMYGTGTAGACRENELCKVTGPDGDRLEIEYLDHANARRVGHLTYTAGNGEARNTSLTYYASKTVATDSLASTTIALSPSGSPTSATTALHNDLFPEQPVRVATLNPVLEVPPGPRRSIEYQVSTTADFATEACSSGWVPSQSGYGLPASCGLVDGGTYYWRVRARTSTALPVEVSPWTPAGSFIVDLGAHVTSVTLLEPLPLGEIAAIFASEGLVPISFTHEGSNGVGGFTMIDTPIATAYAQYRTLYASEEGPGSDPLVTEFTLAGAVGLTQLSAIGSNVANHSIDAMAESQQDETSDGSGAAFPDDDFIINSGQYATQAYDPARPWVPREGTVQFRGLSNGNRQMLHRLVWGSRASLDAFGNDAYEHDVKLVNKGNNGTLIWPLCLPWEANNFYMVAHIPRALRRVAVRYFSTSFPPASKPYFDKNPFSDSCEVMDITVGVARPTLLEPNHPYTISVITPAGDTQGSTYKLFAQKRTRLNGSVNPNLIGLSPENSDPSRRQVLVGERWGFAPECRYWIPGLSGQIECSRQFPGLAS